MSIYATTLTLEEAAAAGNSHFRVQCARQQRLIPALIQALTDKNLRRATNAYTAARPPYEQIETLANAFSTIDQNIDARPYACFTGEDDPEWQGFHYIERALYRDQDVGQHVLDMAVKLSGEVDKLCATLNDVSLFRVFDGATALAFEVPAKRLLRKKKLGQTFL